MHVSRKTDCSIKKNIAYEKTKKRQIQKLAIPLIEEEIYKNKIAMFNKTYKIYNSYCVIISTMANNTGKNQGRQEQTDIKMNSLELQKIFYTTYKEFFNTHDMVLSGDAVLTW